MDPFAHIQEIKLIATIALGFFCYRQLSKSVQQNSFYESDEELSQISYHPQAPSLNNNNNEQQIGLIDEQRQSNHQNSQVQEQNIHDEQNDHIQNIIGLKSKQNNETPISLNTQSQEKLKRYPVEKLRYRRKIIKKSAHKGVKNGKTLRRKLRDQGLQNMC